MAFAYREMLGSRVIGFSITTSCVLVGILSVFGPLGSYESLSLLQRFLSCVVCAAFGWPVCYSMTAVTFYVMRNRTPTKSALAASLAMLIAAVPCTAVASAYQTLFLGDDSAYDGFLMAYLLVASLAVACSLLFLYIVRQRVKLRAESAGTAGMTDAQRRDGGADAAAAGAVASGKGDAIVAAASDVAPAGPQAHPRADDTDRERAVDRLPVGAAKAHVRFFERLPIEIGRELVYIKTEDHYLAVYTTGGSARVLARFADVVGELGELGMQVHRCYWVAHRGMAELVTRGNRTLLRLAGGHEVPVSHTYLRDVQAVLGA